MDHVVGYFGFTLMFCLAWPRPVIVGGILIVSAALLEGEPRVVIVSDPHAPLDQLNEALSKLVPCKLEEERVQSE